MVDCFLNPTEHNSIIKKGFSTLKVDRINRAQFHSLQQDLTDILQGHRARLPRATPNKAVIAFIVALVG